MTKRILCFDAFPTAGGGQKRLAKHIQQLLADGHEVTIACPPGNPFLDGLATEDVRAISVPMSSPITNWSTRPRGFSAFRAYAALTWQLVPLLTRETPDLIYALGSRSAKAILLAAMLTKVPLTWTSGNLHPVGWTDRQLMRRSRGVICLCNAIRDQYVSLPEAQGKLQVIYGSVDVDTLAAVDGSGVRAELGLTRDDVLLGVVGRISPLKGQKEFLEAILPIMVVQPHVHAAIVGAPAAHDMAYHRELLDIAQRSTVSQRIHFAGWRSDTPEVTKALDVLVLPSYEEPFGNILLEGMAAGKPIVATTGGGVPEIVIDGVTGLLVEPLNGAALAGAIAKLTVDAALRTRYGQDGQDRARHNFDDSTILRQVSLVFDRILADSPAMGLPQ